MHDPKLLAILDRREPVTLVDRFDVRDNHFGVFNLGNNLAYAAFGALSELWTKDQPWVSFVAWNLTIASLLNTAARRALYQTNVFGAFE